MLEIQKGKQCFVSTTVPKSISFFIQASEQLTNRTTLTRTTHSLYGTSAGGIVRMMDPPASHLGPLHLPALNCFRLDICKAVTHSRNYLGFCLLLGEKMGLKSGSSRTESNIRLSKWRMRSCLFNNDHSIVNIYLLIWKTWFLVSLSGLSYLIFTFP